MGPINDWHFAHNIVVGGNASITGFATAANVLVNTTSVTAMLAVVGSGVQPLTIIYNSSNSPVFTIDPVGGIIATSASGINFTNSGSGSTVINDTGGGGVFVQNTNVSATPGVTIQDTAGDGIVITSANTGSTDGITISDFGAGVSALGLQLNAASKITASNTGTGGTAVSDSGGGGITIQNTNASGGVTLSNSGSGSINLLDTGPFVQTQSATGTSYAITSVSNAVGANTTYHGTFPSASLPTTGVFISGFTNLSNNGLFAVVSNTATTLVVNNSAGVAETHAGTALVGGGLTMLNSGVEGIVISDSGVGGVAIEATSGGVSVAASSGGHVSVTSGTANPLIFPATTGTSGYVLSTNGANPQQLSWIAAGGGGTPSLDQVTNPVASKTFSLGGHNLAFNDAVGTSVVTTTSGAGLNLWNDFTPSGYDHVNITSVDTSSGGNTTYHNTFGSFPATSFAGYGINISGFDTSSNNGIFTIVSNTTSTIVVNNPSAVAETPDPSGIAHVYVGTIGSTGIDIRNLGSGGTFIADYGGGGISILDNSTGGFGVVSRGVISLENNQGGASGVSSISIINRSFGGSLNLENTDNLATDVNIGGGVFINDSSGGGVTIQTQLNAGQTISDIFMRNVGSGGTTIEDGSTAFGIFAHSTSSVGQGNGIYLQDDGSGGITVDAGSTGSGHIALRTSAAGLTIQHVSGTVTAGATVTLSGGIQTLTTIDGIVTAATATSDERLKTNIQPFERGLDAIVAINPSSFQWNEAGQDYTKMPAGLVQHGFIAQDIQRALPEAVGREGDYLSIDNRTLIAALVNAVKELAAENKSLKERITRLENNS